MTKDMRKKPEIGIVKKLDTLENQANKVYLALGSNLGDRIKNLEFAKSLIYKSNVKILKMSKNDSKTLKKLGKNGFNYLIKNFNRNIQLNKLQNFILKM